MLLQWTVKICVNFWLYLKLNSLQVERKGHRDIIPVDTVSKCYVVWFGSILFRCVLFFSLLLFLQLSFMLTPINAPRDNNRFNRNKSIKAIFNSSSQDLEEKNCKCHSIFLYCHFFSFSLYKKKKKQHLIQGNICDTNANEEKKYAHICAPTLYSMFSLLGQQQEKKKYKRTESYYLFNETHTLTKTWFFFLVNIINEKRNDLTRQRLTCYIYRHILPSNHI